jgi:hypothetical protein
MIAIVAGFSGPFVVQVQAQASGSPPPVATSADGRPLATDDSPNLAGSGDPTNDALRRLMALDAGDGLNQQLRRLVLQHLPEKYVDDRRWGRTAEVKTLLPRSEPVVMKHGTWQRYEVRPVDPAQTLAIRLRNVRHEQDGRLAFDLECDLTGDLLARQAEWRRGVQLYSLHAAATLRCSVKLACRLAISFDFRAAPTLVLAPEVLAAEWIVHEFRIHRISKVGGELAQQATRQTRKWLDEHAAEHNVKLAEAINKQLRKNPERLRIPLAKK